MIPALDREGTLLSLSPSCATVTYGKRVVVVKDKLREKEVAFERSDSVGISLETQVIKKEGV